MSKGDRYRTVNDKVYGKNWERIFKVPKYRPPKGVSHGRQALDPPSQSGRNR